MSRFTLIVVALSVGLAGVICLGPLMVESNPLNDLLLKFFDDNRVSKCPYTEIQLEGTVGIKQMNDPKPPCKAQCERVGMDSLWGSEQVSFGPKVFCCCKPIDDQLGSQLH